ncbi:Glucose/ribitol dehydrogenase [Penicillium cf. griseofulvum]|nr:Glucose/ribitol dehydrogenase [Penicillium cf. griseofulvum]
MSSEIAEKGEIQTASIDKTPIDHTPESFDEEFIPGYDAILMGALATLSSAEEKKLLRRIDWHLIPLLAVMYMLKSVDFTNVSYARIMDRGTPHNIPAELKMT